jgi:hypothetical protein
MHYNEDLRQSKTTSAFRTNTEEKANNHPTNVHTSGVYAVSSTTVAVYSSVSVHEHNPTNNKRSRITEENTHLATSTAPERKPSKRKKLMHVQPDVKAEEETVYCDQIDAFDWDAIDQQVCTDKQRY